VRLVFTPTGWDDYQWWAGHNRAVLTRINRLLEDVRRHPATGIGKPEALRHALEGCWSRRIDTDHRLVYLVDGEDVVILAARFHYD